MRRSLFRVAVAVACCGLSLPAAALAATYTVGPSGRQYTQLSALVDSVGLGSTVSSPVSTSGCMNRLKSTSPAAPASTMV